MQMHVFVLVRLLKICKYSFYDLKTPNIDTFFRACLHILAFLGSKFMHNAYFENFRFNSIYLDFYCILPCHFSGFNAYVTLTCIIVHFIDVFSYE